MGVGAVVGTGVGKLEGWEVKLAVSFVMAVHILSEPYLLIRAIAYLRTAPSHLSEPYVLMLQQTFLLNEPNVEGAQSIHEAWPAMF